MSGSLKTSRESLPMPPNQHPCRQHPIRKIACEKCGGTKLVRSSFLFAWLVISWRCDKCHGTGIAGYEEEQLDAKAGGQPDA